MAGTTFGGITATRQWSLAGFNGSRQFRDGKLLMRSGRWGIGQLLRNCHAGGGL